MPAWRSATHNRDDVAVVMNTGGGGLQEVAGGEVTLMTKGPDRVSPFMVPMMSPSMAACQISIQNGITGPVITSVAACAAGVQAFVEAQRLIEHGDVDVVVAGGTESAILPVAFAALGNMGALSKRNDDPAAASRPFDANRDGFVFGEAAAVLMVESAEHAEGRGAPILAEIAGGALTADAFHISAPEPSGQGATRAMQRAVRDAHLEPEQVQAIMAHGTSTPLNDATETRAIRAAFGDHADRLAVTSNKSMVGHTLGAAGAISALAAVLAIRDGVLPPTINQETPGPRLRSRLCAERRPTQRSRHDPRQRLRIRRPERGRGLHPPDLRIPRPSYGPGPDLRHAHGWRAAAPTLDHMTEVMGLRLAYRGFVTGLAGAYVWAAIAMLLGAALHGDPLHPLRPLAIAITPVADSPELAFVLGLIAIQAGGALVGMCFAYFFARFFTVRATLSVAAPVVALLAWALIAAGLARGLGVPMGTLELAPILATVGYGVLLGAGVPVRGEVTYPSGSPST